MDLGWDGDLTAEERVRRFRTRCREVASQREGLASSLENRPFGWHPAGCDCPWLRPLRQRQGPCRGLDLPGSGADTPRAALLQPARSGGRLSDLRGQEVLARSDHVRLDPEERLSRRSIPIILTSGRLVEYEGGGDESRSNPWLAELQQDMFVEINTRDANNLGVRDGARSGSKGPKAARSR